MKNQKSALQKITGLSTDKLVGIKINNSMSDIGQKASATNRRRIVIERDRLLNTVPPEQAFEIVVEKIARVNVEKRNEVENALIVTGSPISTRGVSQKRLNKMVQNRLTQNDNNGQAFRQYMTVLVGALYGKSLMNDGFFRTPTPTRSDMSETKFGNDAIIMNPRPATEIDTGVSVDNILPHTETADGGVKRTKSEQDWGSILSGSADVIGSIGNVLGLFTGGSPATNTSVFDDYSGGSVIVPTVSDDIEKRQKAKRKMLWTIIGLVLVVGTIITIAVVSKRRNN